MSWDFRGIENSGEVDIITSLIIIAVVLAAYGLMVWIAHLDRKHPHWFDFLD